MNTSWSGHVEMLNRYGGTSSEPASPNRHVIATGDLRRPVESPLAAQVSAIGLANPTMEAP
jgi:hypothetical protein